METWSLLTNRGAVCAFGSQMKFNCSD